MFEKLDQRIKEAKTDFDCYELPKLLDDIKKDYAKMRAEVYDEVCKELSATIDKSRRKRKELLPF